MEDKTVVIRVCVHTSGIGAYIEKELLKEYQSMSA